MIVGFWHDFAEAAFNIRCLNENARFGAGSEGDTVSRLGADA